MKSTFGVSRFGVVLALLVPVSAACGHEVTPSATGPAGTTSLPPPNDKNEKSEKKDGEKKDGEKKDGEKKDGEKKDGEKKSEGDAGPA